MNTHEWLHNWRFYVFSTLIVGGIISVIVSSIYCLYSKSFKKEIPEMYGPIAFGMMASVVGLTGFFIGPDAPFLFSVFLGIVIFMFVWGAVVPVPRH